MSQEQTGIAGIPETVNEDLLAIYETVQKPVYRIYEPPNVTIVMGAGRHNKDDLRLDPVGRDGVPVLIRKGGGGTVVLSPGMVVLALVTAVSHPYQNREYARTTNSWFVRALEDMEVTGIEAKGISDLAIGERKILGSSLFRRQYILFYQASLMVTNDLTLFTRYLTYPSTVPDYRRGRKHEEFCTNLAAEGHKIGVQDLMHRMEERVGFELSRLS